jgi:hypothetical protein
LGAGSATWAVATNVNVAPRSAAARPTVQEIADPALSSGNAGLNASVEIGSITKLFNRDKGK